MQVPERLRRLSWRTRSTMAVLVVAGVVAGLAACTGGGHHGDPNASEAPQLSLPPPSFDDVPVVTFPDGFVQPDTRSVRLTPVTARPTGGAPALAVYGGNASISGVVNGPNGPVPGATVKIERWVGSRSGSVLVTAGGDGRYSARNLLGGRYRVRAWLQPSLAATQSQVLFLANDGTATADVDVSQFDGTKLQASLDVSSLNVDDTAHVRALLTRAAVDGDGIVSGQPVPAAAVQLTAPDGLSVSGTNPATTSDSGQATFSVTCTREGTYTVSLSTDGAATTYTLPTCGPKPVPTTTTPNIPDFAVGDQFTVPRGAPLPPGTYVASADSCATSFQAFVNGDWEAQRRQISGSVMGLLVPARDFQAVDGTTACTYRRTA